VLNKKKEQVAVIRRLADRVPPVEPFFSHLFFFIQFIKKCIHNLLAMFIWNQRVFLPESNIEDLLII